MQSDGGVDLFSTRLHARQNSATALFGRVAWLFVCLVVDRACSITDLNHPCAAHLRVVVAEEFGRAACTALLLRCNLSVRWCRPRWYRIVRFKRCFAIRVPDLNVAKPLDHRGGINNIITTIERTLAWKGVATRAWGGKG